MYLLEIKQRENDVEVGEGKTVLQESTLWRVIYDLFIAGTDTTTNTLMWLMLYMAIYPDVQKQVRRAVVLYMNDCIANRIVSGVICTAHINYSS